MIEHLQYCTRCIMPETQEGVKFDDFGVCTACRSSEEKMHLNWSTRRKDLETLLEDAKAKSGENYDCIIPISGGKDSFFQLHVLVKQYGMKPLAVTFNHNWLSKTGYYNLMLALETFNVDHMQFTPARSTVNTLAKKSLAKIGDSCWHCHAGVGAFPLQVAVKWNIPLLIWGESIAEASGRASYSNPVRKFDRDYFEKVSAKVSPEEMSSDNPIRLGGFNPPSPQECEAVGIHGIHLGDFLFWDDERQMEFVVNNYGWRETEMEGTYKCYKSAECIMAGVHDYTCHAKRGYGRASYQASVDVRNGLLTRDEAMALAEKHDPERPHALDYYLNITDQTEAEFEETLSGHRHEKLSERPAMRHKTRPHPERLLPFPLQVIDEMASIYPQIPSLLPVGEHDV